MPTNKELDLAKKLIGKNLVSRMAMQRYLDELDTQRKLGKKTTLENLLIQDQAISQQELQLLQQPSQIRIVHCSSCNMMYRIKEEDIGKKFKCHKCKKNVVVPKPGETQAKAIKNIVQQNNDEPEFIQKDANIGDANFGQPIFDSEKIPSQTPQDSQISRQDSAVYSGEGDTMQRPNLDDEDLMALPEMTAFPETEIVSDSNIIIEPEESDTLPVKTTPTNNTVPPDMPSDMLSDMPSDMPPDMPATTNYIENINQPNKVNGIANKDDMTIMIDLDDEVQDDEPIVQITTPQDDEPIVQITTQKAYASQPAIPQQSVEMSPPAKPQSKGDDMTIMIDLDDEDQDDEPIAQITTPKTNLARNNPLPITPPISKTPPTAPPISKTPPTAPPINKTPPAAPPISKTPPTAPPISKTPPTAPPISKTPPTAPPINKTPPAAPPITAPECTIILDLDDDDQDEEKMTPQPSTKVSPQASTKSPSKVNYFQRTTIDEPPDFDEQIETPPNNDAISDDTPIPSAEVFADTPPPSAEVFADTPISEDTATLNDDGVSIEPISEETELDTTHDLDTNVKKPPQDIGYINKQNEPALPDELWPEQDDQDIIIEQTSESSLATVKDDKTPFIDEEQLEQWAHTGDGAKGAEKIRIEPNLQQILASKTPDKPKAVQLSKAEQDRLNQWAKGKLPTTSIPPQNPTIKTNDIQIVREISKNSAIITKEVMVGQKHLLMRMITPEIPTSALDLESEIFEASKLSHENIIPIYELKTYGSQLYYTTQYIEKADELRQIWPRTASTQKQIISVGAQLLQALVYAHGLGIIHGFLDWETIVLQKNRPLICDFGLSSLYTQKTILDRRQGKFYPVFMSPEQLRRILEPSADNLAKIDRRSDIYSLGMILYWMVTQRPPFKKAEDYTQAIHQFKPIAPADLDSSVSTILSYLIMKAISKQPHERYPSAQEMLSELLEISEE